MKKILLGICGLVLMSSCKENSGRTEQVYVQPQPNVVVTPETYLGDNLNLEALGELVRTSPDAQTIEAKLNSDGSINNLDLDGDGQVDYIRVTETLVGAVKGFAFTVDQPDGTSQEVATVEIQRVNGSAANMNVQGNPNYYGQNNYYTSSHHLSDLMVMGYLYGYHRPYVSPYHYGNYPSNYRTYRSVPTTSYSSRVKTTTTTTHKISPSISSKKIVSTPKTSNLSSKGQSMAAPTSSQKSFGVTSASKAKPVTTGFKKSTPSSSYTSSSSSYTKPKSYSSSSSSRKSSSFGSNSRSSSKSSSSRSSSSRSKR